MEDEGERHKGMREGQEKVWGTEDRGLRVRGTGRGRKGGREAREAREARGTQILPCPAL
jgi:hypothetical protein